MLMNGMFPNGWTFELFESSGIKDGERGRNRTFNLLIKSQLLCQLSYAPTLFRTAFIRLGRFLEL